jgi:hypothetical protein
MKRDQGNEIQQNYANLVEGDAREVYCIEVFDRDLEPARVQPVKPIVGAGDDRHPAYQYQIIDGNAPQQNILDRVHGHGKSSTKRYAEPQ